MKTNKMLVMVVVLLSSFHFPNLHAQSYARTDASTVEILSDTTYMTAMRVTMPPGYKTTLHTHPAHFVFALTDGTLSVAYKDGQKIDVSLKAGDHFSAPPDAPHQTTNLGTKPVTYLLIEFKDHPYVAENMKK